MNGTTVYVTVAMACRPHASSTDADAQQVTLPGLVVRI